MPCAYDRDDNFGCQFEHLEYGSVRVDQKLWCIFHAPLKDANGQPTAKENWPGFAIDDFYRAISTLRENAIREGNTLNLSGVVFPGDANFQGKEFPEVDFSYCNFTGAVAFLDARFKGRADFRAVIFKMDTDFTNARFCGGYAYFNEARFEGGVVFSGARFEWMSFFHKTIFSAHGTQFIGAEFYAQANFEDAEFNACAEFQHVKYKGNANFLNTKFNKSANFYNARFGREAYFNSSGSNPEVDAFKGVVFFQNAEFIDTAMFENRNFQQATDIRNCTFHKAPRFHGCQLHQYTDFTDARFFDTASPGSAMAYRTLKLDMEEKRARQEQLRFYALEMKSRRHSEKRKFMKFISWMYGATSDYGQRIFLPLAWLVYSFLVFAFFYAAYFKGLLDLDAASILPQSLHFSIKQVIRPFGVFASSSLAEFFAQTPSANLMALPLIIAATLQSFLSLALLLLSGLAARWRFKIG